MQSMLFEHLIPKSWPLLWSWSPLCCYNSLHSSGEGFPLNVGTLLQGDLLPFSHKCISEVGHWCWAIRPGSQSQCFNSSQRCLMGLRSGMCAGQLSSYEPISTNHFCMDLALCTGALSCWNRKEPSPNCCHKGGSTESSRMSLFAVALRFPITGT
jgi:hypothetical protein